MSLLTAILFCSILCLATAAYPTAIPVNRGNVMAHVQASYWQNDYDGWLHVECGPTEAIEWVSSIHDNYREDRQWKWSCKHVIGGYGTCTWFKYINDYQEDLDFECPENQYMGGVMSGHDNNFEDRVWSVKCCQKIGVCTANDRTTDYINNYDDFMSYRSDYEYVFAGLASTFDSSRNDRIWKVHERELVYC